MQLYKENLLPKQAWDILVNEANAFLIDVRTWIECHYVGQPNLQSIKKIPMIIEWRILPNMDLNPNFYDQILTKIPDKSSSLIFLCSRGGRSQEAASSVTTLGYGNCYNVLYGFDGDINERGQRGLINGWKADQLPWRQD